MSIRDMIGDKDAVLDIEPKEFEKYVKLLSQHSIPFMHVVYGKEMFICIKSKYCHLYFNSKHIDDASLISLDRYYWKRAAKDCRKSDFDPLKQYLTMQISHADAQRRLNGFTSEFCSGEQYAYKNILKRLEDIVGK
jgi:hypothetical protein